MVRQSRRFHFLDQFASRIYAIAKANSSFAAPGCRAGASELFLWREQVPVTAGKHEVGRRVPFSFSFPDGFLCGLVMRPSRFDDSDAFKGVTNEPAQHPEQ